MSELCSNCGLFLAHIPSIERHLGLHSVCSVHIRGPGDGLVDIGSTVSDLWVRETVPETSPYQLTVVLESDTRHFHLNLLSKAHSMIHPTLGKFEYLINNIKDHHKE